MITFLTFWITNILLPALAENLISMHFCLKPYRDSFYRLGPFYSQGISLIPAWINNYIQYKVWDDITNQFLSLNGVEVDVRKCIINFVSHFTDTWLRIHAGTIVNPQVNHHGVSDMDDLCTPYSQRFPQSPLRLRHESVITFPTCFPCYTLPILSEHVYSFDICAHSI